jgi:serine/threonine-protein kinase
VRGYPIDLEKIVMKALSKNKNERYRTAREFSRALQSLLMRRGLFVASDEVATYMQSLFGDRIRKREEHLRWAADVTHTLNVDRNKVAPPSTPWGSDDTTQLASSEVHTDDGDAEDMPTVARGMSRSELADIVGQAEKFDDADTVVSGAPDMGDAQPTTAEPTPKVSVPGSVPPSSGVRPLPPFAQSIRETSYMTTQSRRAVPTVLIALGATLLGLLAFVVVLYTLSHLSTPGAYHR